MAEKLTAQRGRGARAPLPAIIGVMDSSAPVKRIAVIGAGPAGFYAAEALVKTLGDGVSVDIIERLPTPYGLVRYGVAPDHQKMKSVTRLYDRTLADPHVRFLGNVEFGTDLTLEDLQRHYHAVILTVGSSHDRRLGVPGEDLEGSMSATEFVAWYNSHPDYQDLQVPLDAKTAVVVGVGNVAIDVTRVLAKTVAELATTDIADHALRHLQSSTIEDIVIIGRRGPAESKFTTKELRELGELANADIYVRPEELEVGPESLAAIEGDVNAQKNLEVLRAFSQQAPSGKPRRVHIRFFLSPLELKGNGHVTSVVLGKNRLEVRADGSIAAVPTGATEELNAELVFRSVGYQARPLPGVPFDERRAVVPNEMGRVLDAQGGTPVPGLYVAGWVKRGPSGVIGTNKACAMETVAKLVEDELPAPIEPSPAALDALLAERGVKPFTARDWRLLDEIETAAGEALGRPRVKVPTVNAMLAAVE